MKFDYVFVEGKFLPIVPIQIKMKGEWLEINAFVDTGASYCLFPADVAEVLGVGFYIIGTKDIFDEFKVCFHQKEKYVEFTAVDYHAPLHP
jgi:hypothetical protein